MGERSKLEEIDINYCKNQLNETTENTEKCLKALKEYLIENHNLNAKTDDFNLLRFLRASKFDVEKAKKKITCFYKLRGECDPWFKDRNPNLDEINELLKIGLFLPLLQRDPDGRTIIIVRPVKHDPKIHSIDNVFRVGFMVLDLFFDRFEDASVYGVRAIFDMDGLSVGHVRQLTIPVIRRAVHSWQDCYPVRIKSLDWINSPSYINIILNIFKSFMNAKIKKRVHVHGNDLTEVHDRISKEILPEEYGGSNGKLEELIIHWRKEVLENSLWYQQDELFKYTAPL